jgi:competence protein ComEA
MVTLRFALPLALALAAAAHAQLPDGPGKDAVLQVCATCHGPEVIVGHRQSRDEWVSTMQQMITEGAQGTEEQFNAVLGYLVKNFGPQVVKININQASAADLQSGFGITEKEAAAIVKHRTEKGAFKVLEDLKKVPDLDYKKIEIQKDRLAF